MNFRQSLEENTHLAKQIKPSINSKILLIAVTCKSIFTVFKRIMQNRIFINNGKKSFDINKNIKIGPPTKEIKNIPFFLDSNKNRYTAIMPAEKSMYCLKKKLRVQNPANKNITFILFLFWINIVKLINANTIPARSGRIPLFFHRRQVEFNRIMMPIIDDRIDAFCFRNSNRKPKQYHKKDKFKYLGNKYGMMGKINKN